MSIELRAFSLTILCLWMVPAISRAEIIQTPEADNRVSIYALGDLAVKNLFDVGHGYGEQFCSHKEITKIEDIKGKAWEQIRSACRKFTFGIQNSFTDDPNELFSLCIGGALDACQKELGIEPPCHDLSSCQALLGIPD